MVRIVPTLETARVKVPIAGSLSASPLYFAIMLTCAETVEGAYND